MKHTIKFESSISIKGVKRIIDISIPEDISDKTNAYDAYAEGYSQAFNDLTHEVIETFNYGANNVNQIIDKLNDKNRAKLNVE